MKNMAYTPEYLTYRTQQSAVFCTDYLQDEMLITLSPLYQIKKHSYVGEVGSYTIRATENELLNEQGEVIYYYHNINDDNEFHKIIAHSNGNSYLLFRRDLYGYSVLNLTTLQDFHYIPSDSFPEGETFIWVDVSYNIENNLLAVSGCYWACPSGTLLQDFSSPMTAPAIWVDVLEQLEGGYDSYDDVDFLKWQGTDLILNAWDCDRKEKTIICLSQQNYMIWLRSV